MCGARTLACCVHTRVNVRIFLAEVLARVPTRHAGVRTPRLAVKILCRQPTSIVSLKSTTYFTVGGTSSSGSAIRKKGEAYGGVGRGRGSPPGITDSQVTLDAVAETGVHPRDAHQNQPENDERQNAVDGFK